ncbi:MAG: SMI1/KNR4 family protein [Chloroflexota bacterium]
MSEALRDFLLSGPKINTHIGQLYTLEEMPDVCPWAVYRGEPIERVIDQMFAPLAERLTLILHLLKTRCSQITVLLDNQKWYLIYVLQSGEGEKESYLCGGSPVNLPTLPDSVREAGWTLPKQLAELYAIHNGFGMLWPLDLFWNSDCVLPSNHLRVLAQIFSADMPKSIDYDPNHLLEFFSDGGGNGQYFYRFDQNDSECSTVDWDHETRELSHPADFWSFVDTRLGELIR